MSGVDDVMSGYGDTSSTSPVAAQGSGIMDDCMVDLETMDNCPGGAILSIGAVMFNKTGLGQEFYVVIDEQSCLDLGLTRSQETYEWWMKQAPEARVILHPETPKVSIQEGLRMFSQWCKDVGVKYVWGNGSDFDNAFMAIAYRRAGMPLPWKYSNNRCYRTVKNGAYISARRGTYHNALDDAKNQALHMISAGLCQR